MKEVIERCNWLVNKCEDKAITPDVKDDVSYLLEEIERLNNIINNFEKWLLGEQMMFYKSSDGEILIRFGETKNKWLELKGDSSNE